MVQRRTSRFQPEDRVLANYSFCFSVLRGNGGITCIDLAQSLLNNVAISDSFLGQSHRHPRSFHHTSRVGNELIGNVEGGTVGHACPNYG